MLILKILFILSNSPLASVKLEVIVDRMNKIFRISRINHLLSAIQKSVF